LSYPASQKDTKIVKQIVAVLWIAALLLGSCASPAREGVLVSEAWARPAPQGANGAVYFVIENNSSQADSLVGVSGDIAEAVEMHESSMNGEVMEMHQLQVVPLDAGAQVVFQPGGLHVMLIGLRQELQAGDEFEITLAFQESEGITLRVPVRDSPAGE
jgi:copper(I)-binding protein